MGDSLQDQLRALGLAKQEQAAKKRRKPGRGQGRGGPVRKKDSSEMSLDKAWALRAKEEKETAAQKRARKIEEDRRRREINRAIREIIGSNRLNRDDAEVARNFMFRNRIRKVYVTPEQNRALGEGALGLVYVTGRYHVLDSEHVEAVRKIAPDHVVDLESGDDPADDEFPVPDDLDW